MRKLSFLIILSFSILKLMGQSPHGDDFEMDCANCHSSESWELLQKEMSFSHSKTGFDLKGQHQFVDCRSCHSSLKFVDAKDDCVSCHLDMHQNTVGIDCERCHTLDSWIVRNPINLHRQTRFPLIGAHATADCFSCHEDASSLQFEPLSIECVDCHQPDYLATTSPNHQESGYSTDCLECHGVKSVGWSSSNFEHDFFPLQGGHSISCIQCHTSGSFEKISNECISCHQTDYNSTQNPNHQQLNFSTNCAECHTIEPGWESADFKSHDAQFFPIYSGSHRGEWSNCTDCHSNSSNYAEFSCTNCHEHSQSRMDGEHGGISGYSYKSSLCYACHPQGRESGAFNHSSTGFLLTAAHATPDCADCHTNGYAGTSSECVSCHQTDYNQAINPNHQSLSLAVSCEQCHSTNPNWDPASFPVHNTYFELTGAHASISNDCATCHEGNYTSTQNTCYACHTNDYNGTSDPNHQAQGFSTDCQACHTTNAWEPASFDHNTTGFALTGAHSTINSCVSCHTNGYSNTPNNCYACHTNDYNGTSDPNHAVANFPVECESCHTTNAWKPASFNHDSQYFPIYSGRHRGEWNSCSDCHTNSSNYSIFSCIDCHEHNRTETDSDHRGVNNYAYNSAACLECHPQGRED